MRLILHWTLFIEILVAIFYKNKYNFFLISKMASLIKLAAHRAKLRHRENGLAGRGIITGIRERETAQLSLTDFQIGPSSINRRDQARA